MGVHSNDTNQHWKTKLQRIQNRSANRSDAVFNNLGHIINKEMLMDIFHGQSGARAVGIDEVSKAEYGEKLDANITELLRKIRNGSYRPKASRIVEIPKVDGGTRPLAISCFEDKLVQSAVKRILEALYEPIFKDGSHGFRPNRSCHTALRKLAAKLYSLFSGAVVEVDLRKCFNTIPHDKLFNIIGQKVKDERFFGLLKILVRAPILNGDGKVELNKVGCPQGSILSPLLCNIYLDIVLDRWFEDIQPYFKGKQQSQIRYCDDVVWIFEKAMDAQRFFNVLPRRLAKYGLTINESKSGIIRAGHNYSKYLVRQKRRAQVFRFLGFDIYWGRTEYGSYRPRFKSQGLKLRAILARLQEYLTENLSSRDFERFLKGLYSRVRGWARYHAISGNQMMVGNFLQACRHLLFKWWNRRSQRRSVDLERFNKILKRLKFPTCPPVYRLYDFKIGSQ